MARLNFEKEFEKKLQDRELQPSEGSWEKLQKRLDAEEKKSRTPWWIGIAASVAGGLLILNVAFNSEDIRETKEIVDAPSEEIVIEPEKTPSEEIELASEELVSEEQAKSLKEVQPISERRNESKRKEPAPESTAVAAVIENEEGKEQGNKDLADLKPLEEEISGSLEEVMAEISSEESKNKNITDAEVDELLRKAAAKISMEKSSAVTENIDPKSLLWEVEMELERNFREKVFDVLKESYLKTKTAVANRNF